MRKKLALLIACFCLFIGFVKAQSQSQQQKYRNNSIKGVDSSDYRFKNTLYIGSNFYTFDRLGIEGLHPTFYTLNYKRVLSKTKHTYWELGWNFFLPQRYAFLYGSNIPPYAGKTHTFNTLRIGIGKRLLNNALGISAGLNYKYGIEGEVQYLPGVGKRLVTYIANTPGLHTSLNYQFILGKHKRFVIEPIVRYEYYFSGITSHYMVGANAGYKF